jgi:hypothetical protein
MLRKFSCHLNFLNNITLYAPLNTIKSSLNNQEMVTFRFA